MRGMNLPQEQPEHSDAESTRLPSFHDGYLVSISADTDRVTLGLTTESGARFSVTLNGVLAFKADDFRAGDMQNIVYRLQTICGEKIPAAIFAEAEEVLAWRKEQKYELLDAVQTGELTLIHMYASLGCEFLGICQSVSSAPA